MTLLLLLNNSYPYLSMHHLVTLSNAKAIVSSYSLVYSSSTITYSLYQVSNTMKITPIF